MMETSKLITNLNQAHDDVVAFIQSIPDEAMDWAPPNGEWSLKRIVGHLAHANDFYVMIAEEAQRSNFSSVDLNQDLDGKQRMRLTDQEIASSATTAMLLDVFERAYQRMLNVLQTIPFDELDQPFDLTERNKTHKTILRQRVFETATQHFYEHQPQLVETLAQWRTAQLEK